MIKRSTWIMLAVFALLLVFARYWTQSHPGETVAEPTAAPDAIWQAQTSEVTSFKVEDLQSGDVLELRRDAEFGWALVQPVEGPANAGKVEQVVSWLANPVPTRVLAPQNGLLEYGLLDPKYRITVNLEGDMTHVLYVGNNSPTASSTYVQLDGADDVDVVSKLSLDSVVNLVTQDLLVTPTPEVTMTPEVTATGTSAP